ESETVAIERAGSPPKPMNSSSYAAVGAVLFGTGLGLGFFFDGDSISTTMTLRERERKVQELEAQALAKIEEYEAAKEEVAKTLASASTSNGSGPRAGPARRRAPWNRAHTLVSSSGNGKSGDSNDSDSKRDDKKAIAELDPELLRAALNAALKAGLSGEDLGALQGALIASLTREGTKLGSADLPLLFDALGEVDDFGLEKLVLTHLERLEGNPAEMVDGYLDYLEGSKKAPHREEIFDLLVKVGGDEAFRGLKDLVESSDNPKLRREAALSLAELKDPRAAQTLSFALDREADPDAQRQYAEALAKLGGDRAISTVLDFVLRNGDAKSTHLLRSIDDPNAGPLIAAELRPNTHADYQKYALKKLGSLGDPRTLGDLERYLRTSGEKMQLTALSAIGRFDDLSAARLLERYASREGDDSRLGQYASRAAERVHKNIAKAEQKQAARETKRSPKLPKSARKAQKKAKKVASGKTPKKRRNR
ncbi:MAG: HEAT repeat domain-containing protein, partial [Planctomycetota bacterium]